jgi:predicted NodU family carbamoyl transferase
MKTLSTKETAQLGIGGVMHREFQEKLFNDIKAMQYKIQGLAAYVQNDFERMLEDGTTTKETINTEITEMDEQYNKFINDLNILRKQAHDLMTFHGA